MIQDKIISAVSSLGSAGQALTMAAARQEFEASKKERARIDATEKAKEAEYQDIQAGLTKIRSGVLESIESITKDPKTGELIYPEGFRQELQSIGTGLWTEKKSEKYRNQFADPEKAREALGRLNSYSQLLQDQRSMFKDDPEFLADVQQRTLKAYRRAELSSLKDERDSTGGK